MSGHALTRGYILHQYPYRNTSLLVEAFTAEAGRVGLVAHGARRQGRSSRVLLQPFRPLLLNWSSGRGALKTLTTFDEEPGSWRTPQGPALFAGYYCNELILRLLERDSAEPGAFAAYERVVAELVGDQVPQAALRLFEFDLLTALGYVPELTTTADAGVPVVPATAYDYFPDSGPVEAGAAAAVPGCVRVQGSDLLALVERDLSATQALQATRRMLRLSLEPLLGPRPLQSRRVYRSLYGSG